MRVGSINTKKINFKATIENQQDVNEQLEKLKHRNYHPAVFVPDYDEKVNSLENKELLQYRISAEIVKNNMCNKLYNLLNEKLIEIKNYGNQNDTICIGSRTDNVSVLSYTNPKEDNNVVSPSYIYYPTSRKLIEQASNNLVNDILSLSENIFETVKSKHFQKIQKFEELHGDINKHNAE